MFHFFIEMFAILHLNDLQNLHRHIWLIQDTTEERKRPEITGIRVTNRQVNIGNVR